MNRSITHQESLVATMVHNELIAEVFRLGHWKSRV
jgi:hypothetical protein